MGYELFNPKEARIGSPVLTINRDGKITLNADAGDLLRHEGAKFIQILWDAGASKMALRPFSKLMEGSYKLTTKSGRRGMVVSGFAFLRHIHWNFSKSVTVPVEWNEKEKLLEASLPREKVGSNTDSRSES
jgi:hypothetical protein